MTAKQYDPTANARQCSFKPVAITPQQNKLWVETRATLLWHQPAFAHILYSMMNPRGTENVAYFTTEVPIAATDGINLFLNPEPFFKYTLQERVFIVAHEIMHCIFDHCGLMHAYRQRAKIGYMDGTQIDYHPELMNVATDLVINDLLVESKVGSFNKDWLHDPKIATQMDSAIDAYRKLYKNAKKGGGKGGQGQGQGPTYPGNGKGFDEHLAPGTGEGKDPTVASQERNATEWQTAVAAAAASARAQGKLPAGLERLFGEILDPVVDWREKIQAIFHRKVGSGSYDWRKADRRLITRDPQPIFAPGRSGFGCGTVVVGIDTSGSIGAKELDMFMAEMAGILEDAKPKRMVLIWCDARVGRVDEAEEASDLMVIRGKGVPGGGGTAFEPVFEEVEKMGLDDIACLVYLTDGMGSFPKAPSYPVIWGSIYEPSKYPFGEVVYIPVNK